MTTNLKTLKVAIVIDWLWRVRGAEKVLDAILEIFPNSEIFTLFGNVKYVKELDNIHGKVINYSFLNSLPFIKQYYRYTYFLWPIAIESFKFDNFDLVFSISSSVAKGVITNIKTPHICYMNSPMRYAWDLSSNYFNRSNFSLWKRLVIPFFLHYLRIWDTNSNHFDYLITNSKYISKRVEKFYNIEADRVIYPFVKTIPKYEKVLKEPYYLYFGAFEPNKGVVECLETAIKYNFQLVIAGDGSLNKRIHRLSKGHTNIKVLNRVNDELKFELMKKAQALLFPSKEDFGIVALEAMSLGTPVIALSESGTAEIIQEGINGYTIIDSQPKHILNAIGMIKRARIKPKDIINTIKEYNKERFVKEIESTVTSFLD